MDNSESIADALNPANNGGGINGSWGKLSFEALVDSFLWSFVRKLKSLVKKLYKVIKMSAKFLKLMKISYSCNFHAVVSKF